MLSKFSVKKPYTVIVAVVLILILGVVSFTEMTTDLLPSLDLPYVMVMTTYPGASPEEVEQTVTRPIEQSMATVSNINSISSTSSENYSMVVLEFVESANMDSVTLDIRESLDTISGNWDDSIGSPIIMKLNPDMLPVMIASVDVDDMTTTEVSSYVNDDVIPELESIAGVASVSASGLIEETVNVVIDQNKIDKVNEEIQAAVNEELDDAEAEMKEKQEEIEDGKEELEEQSEELTKGMTAASQGITAARLEMLKGEIQMAQSEAELAAKEAEMATAEKELATQEKTLAKNKKELLKNEKTVNKNLSSVKTGLEEIEKSEKELTATKTTLENSIAAIESNANLTEEMKTAQTAALKENLTKVTAGLTELTAKKTELTTTKTTLESALAEIATGKTSITSGEKELKKAKKELKAGKKAIEDAKDTLAKSKKELEAGKATLNEKEAELNSQKFAAESGISSASSQLSSGEQQLDAQLDSFDDTRESALEAADIKETITADMVTQILQAENFSMPAGYVTEEGVDYLIRVGNKVEDVEELSQLVLFDVDMDGIDPIKLEDVADVFWSDNSANTYAKINGNPGVMLSIQKQSTYSTAEVSDKIADKLEDMTKENQAMHVTSLMDQGIYIDMIIDSVLNNLMMGAVLAIIILLLFLRDLKPTFIIACSIPISVIFAIVLMYFSGVTLNMISLSGLAVGVGMLVDNSVVVIENIYRLRSKGATAIQAAVSGASQVAGAIVSSTLTTVCVFLPIVFIEGITRQLFVDMALTIGYSLLASLIVALTFVPAMSAGILKKTKEKEHKIFDVFLRGYKKALAFTLKVKPVALLLVVLILAGSIWAAVQNGTAFMPDMDSTQISVTMTMPEGAVLEDTIEMSDTIMERIEQIEDVETVGAMLSGGSSSLMGMGSTADDAVEMYINLKEDKIATSQEIAHQIEQSCADLDCEVTASGSTMDMSALGGSGVTIHIKGPELETLQQLASEAAEKLETIEGLKDISDGMEDPTPEFRVVVNKEKAMLKGLTVAQIYMELQSEIADSKTATTLTKDGMEYEVNISSTENEAMTREDIENHVFTVTDKEGKKKNVKLKKIAEVHDTETMSSINRSEQQRYITVSAAVEDGYNVGLLSQDVEQTMKLMNIPAGYELEFSGENETINEAMWQLVKMLLLAIAFIYLIMVAQFQSLLSPFIVMFTIPLAFTGGFLGLVIMDMEVSVISMIGFVMLSGIVVNNGIVLVDYINQLRQEGYEKKDAILEAGVTRMRPILMTALTTILGLLPMTMAVGMGADMMQPIAVVTVGGLLYATFTTLFIIPVMYDILNRKKYQKIDESEFELLED